MQALVIIDMLNDFMAGGAVGNPRADHIVDPIGELLKVARANRDDWLVVYANDAHLPDDFELAVWGEHAMAGTPAAEIIPALAAVPTDVILPKRSYSSFYETGLDPLLRQHGVDTLVLTGQHTNCCLRHTSADAFFRGYGLIVPPDATEALSDEDQTSGLSYLRQMYKVRTPSVREILGS